MKWLKQNPALAFVLACFCLTIAVIFGVSLRMNDGNFVYGLDDAYIHMAVAKNFVRHGVWGVTAEGFTSSTSSLAWPLMLAVFYAVTGPNVAAPLLLNLIFAVSMIVWLHQRLRRINPASSFLILMLLGIIYVATLPTLAFFGLEHVMHCLVSLVLLDHGARLLCQERQPVNRRAVAVLLLLAALAPTVRYESLFLVAVLGVMFFLRGRRVLALSLAAAAVLPIGLYGLYSLTQGWFFLPNSLMLKTKPPDLHSMAGVLDFFGRPWQNLRQCTAWQVLFALLAGTTVVCLWKTRRRWEPVTMINLATLGAVLVHLLCISSNNSRYDAYLVGMILYGVGLAWHRELVFVASRRLVTLTIGRFVLVAVLICVVSIPMGFRIWYSLRQTPLAMQNIYQQQFSMADFLRRYHRRDAVALNDIGAASYYTELRMLDVWGLANMTIASKKPWDVTANLVHELAQRKGVRLAMVYDSWFLHYGGVPRQWIPLGQWMVTSSVVLGDPTVSIYAVDPAMEGQLLRELREFSPRLPREVIQQGPYVRPQK